jgi:hypothetical protein
MATLPMLLLGAVLLVLALPSTSAQLLLNPNATSLNIMIAAAFSAVTHVCLPALVPSLDAGMLTAYRVWMPECSLHVFF